MNSVFAKLLPLVIFPFLSLPLALFAQAEPDYIRRGDEIEAKYKTYAARLETDFAKLKQAAHKFAPGLERKLKGEPPKPVPYGYQILPRIVKDPPRDKEAARVTVSTPYSWRRTEQFIDWEIPKLEEIEEKIGALLKLEAKDRKPVLEKMVSDYPELESNQRLIDHHIQHNRFWQKAIFEDRGRFDRLTKLHDMVIERNELQGLIKKNQDPALIEKERLYAKLIHAQNDNIRVPAYVTLAHPSPTLWVLKVPVTTDIDDKAFLKRFESIVERVWKVEEKANTHRIDVEIKQIKAPDSPMRGAHLDLEKHVQALSALSKTPTAILTTGSNSTFAIPGRYVALGPQDIAETVLAHEFGHLLGFIDGYFRGYRDLGKDGFEILEIVPDPDDLMCTPNAGRVSKHHFETLLKTKAPSSSPQ